MKFCLFKTYFHSLTQVVSVVYSMFGAYQRWCRTTSTRARFYEKTLDMCGLLDDPDAPLAGKHRELEKAEIQKSEEAVLAVIAAINSFTNPFRLIDKDNLYRYFLHNKHILSL